ncbi:MAG: hypothetical protein HQM09_19555 [Candidatus Riflebacteria bacterium]|nr:hypothetical protein [Candidatus Riflebacteria bacterium]
MAIDPLSNMMLQRYQRLLGQLPGLLGTQSNSTQGIGIGNGIPLPGTMSLPGAIPGDAASKSPVVGPATVSKLDISTVGRQLGELSRAAAGNDSARSGLRALVKEIGSTNDGSNQMSAMLTDLRTMQISDKKTFNTVMGTAGSLNQTGIGVSSFLQTANSLGSSQQRLDLSHEMQSLNSASGTTSDRRQTMQSTLSTVNSIMKLDAGDKRDSLLTKMYSGLDNAKTLSDKNTFLTNFRKNDLNVPGTT